jgi:ribonucleotide monophosphatase NagD (HAD superfamily)
MAAPNAAAADADAAPRREPQAPRLVRGLSELLASGRYTGVFLDQFGVLHDGRDAYPRAAEAVRRAATDAGAAVVVVSNSSRRARGALGRLERLFGFDRAWFRGAVTSGEVAHAALEGARGEVGAEDEGWATMAAAAGEAADEGGEEGGAERGRRDGTGRRRRRRVLHVSWAARAGAGGGIALPEGYATVGADPDAAELIVAHGTEGVAAASDAASSSSPPADVVPMPLAEIQALLARAAARGADAPPMVVANPDLVTVDGPGRLAVMPGTLARAYAAAGGGPVVLMGKPAGRIYRAARALAAAAEEEDEGGRRGRRRRPEEERWLMIGDSLEHDVAGAAAASRELGVAVDALFVAAGIHADELGFVPPADLADANGGVRQGAWSGLSAPSAAAAAAATPEAAPAALAELCARLGVEPPAYATGYLQW